jgi:hypothetical protein
LQRNFRSMCCRSEGQQLQSFDSDAQEPSAAAAAATSSAGAAAPASFILRALLLLPAPLTAPLGEVLLLQPLYSLIGSATAAQELLLETASLAAAEAAAVAHVTAAAAAARRPYSAGLWLLHELGWQLGVAVWQEDWKSRCREPAAAAAGGGVADGSDAAAAAVIEGSAGSGKALVRSLFEAFTSCKHGQEQAKSTDRTAGLFFSWEGCAVFK